MAQFYKTTLQLSVHTFVYIYTVYYWIIIAQPFGKQIGFKVQIGCESDL